MSFGVRGLVEGFYDRLWSWPERARVAAFIAGHGFDTYVYAPKEERLQNAAWREPYGKEERSSLSAFGELCRSLGMAFWIGLRPVGISYAEKTAVARLVAKLAGHLELGADRLVLLADDIPLELEERLAGRFTSLAEAHVWLVGQVLSELAVPPERLVFVPTHYAGSGSPYLSTIGEGLPAGIDVCWTGSDVCCPVISSAEAEAIARVLRRRPLVWDNYPVNDAGMTAQLHLGPIRGRDAGLAAHVRGVLVNPALQPEATLIPLATWGEYLRDPVAYDADEAWRRAVLEVAGNAEDAAGMAVLAAAFDRSVIDQEWRHPRGAELQEAAGRLRRMANRRLAEDLSPFLGGPAPST